MPAFTPNRNYPYSVPGDPADVPQALQDLAEAIDTDLFTLNSTIPKRPAFRVRGTGAYVANTAVAVSPANNLPFDIEDFNTGLPYTLSSDGKIVTPDEPGFYYVLGTVAYPRPTSAGTRVLLDFQITRFTVLTPFTVVRNAIHLVPSPSDQVRTIYAGAPISLSGNQQLHVTFRTQTIAGPPDQYTIGDRTLTVIKMSPTP